MNSYSLQLKSLDNQATAFQTIVAGNVTEALEIAFHAAGNWARGNRTTSVQYTVSLGDWSQTNVRHVPPVIPQPSEVDPVTIKIDSNDKFFAVLDALQQYVHNCDDAIELTSDQDKIRDLAAKSNAAGEVVAQLEEVLVSLAG